MNRDPQERWRRLDAILDELLPLPPAERAARLDALTGDDRDLRAEAADLLERDTATLDRLDRPLGAGIGALLAAENLSTDDPADIGDRRIGPYQVLGRLGEGGMGVVFEAQQSHPSRRVALKVLRAGVFADAAQLRRFHREAESLGRLNHPGIAAILDAGRTDDGLHWFAMERVEGVPLDQWLRERPAPGTRTEIDARVALCLAVCDAISHAHQRGVVHLDLKPTNIMVLPGPDGGGPAQVNQVNQIKVLDFGIARLVGGDAALTTLMPDASALAGTLAYMSPEQAAGDPRDLDVRSDVYSLGVLLYELLTGRHPVNVRGTTLTEAVRLIREQAPARPAAGSRLLRGDLETIVLKALAKEPELRYQSVAALADDIRRCRDNLPISGRPPSSAYQLRKIVARHRTVIVFASALVLALLGAVGGTTFGLVRARRAEAHALAEAAAAAETARFLEGVFRIADPGSGRGAEVTARELLQNAVAEIDTSLAGQPRVRGRLLGAMGTAYRQLGLYRESRPLLEEAVALEREALGPDDPRVARSHYTLAGLLRRLSEYEAARHHYQEALAIRERLGNADDLAVSLTGLANLEFDQSRIAEAGALYRRAMAITAAAGGADSPRYASHLSGLALVHWRLGEADSACAAFERVVAIQRRALAPDNLDLAWSLSTLGRFYATGENIPRARELGEEALAVQERALGPGHTDVAETLDSLGNLHRLDGNFELALAMHERAAAIWEKALGNDNATYAMLLDNVARDLAGLGRMPEAMAAAERAREILARTLDESHPSVLFNQVYLATIYRDAGQPARARPIFEAMLARSTATFGAGSRETTEIVIEMARLAAREQKWAEADHYYARALAGAGALADSARTVPMLRREMATIERRRG
jgi:serine/threonine protein kinase/Tfp pilus assembly protein PilF